MVLRVQRPPKPTTNRGLHSAYHRPNATIHAKSNWAADFMSRMHESHKLRVVNTELSTLALLTGNSIEEALNACHKGPEGHGGMRRTYLALCKKYPGHEIPQRVVSEYVAECPECQKIRHSMNNKFQPLLRANHVEHHKQMIGHNNPCRHTWNGIRLCHQSLCHEACSHLSNTLSYSTRRRAVPICILLYYETVVSDP